jgi:hypothetical protein
MLSETGHKRLARIPDHVVHRDFSQETVVLNIETGQYHGLNATARRMFAALHESESIGCAAVALAREFAMPREQIERDLLELCAALADRGLLELNDSRAA